ncbi:MAG: transporter [Deinococcus sp.]|nr:transporter [Deinococcus sp.]
MTAPDSPHPDPMHGVTLAQILTRLVDAYGWEGMADRVPVRCFELNPSMQSSLKFLRRTPWARAKVEALYLELVLGGAGFTGR